MPKEPIDGFFVESMFGAQLKRGLVVVQMGEKSDPVQIDPAKAREIAGMLLEAAESAETEELLYRFHIEELQMPPDMFAGMLQRFRMIREDNREKAKEGDNGD